jgi:phosphopantothenoylcysteine decarboxylase/phosphopantothenate--cysteine ligase
MANLLLGVTGGIASYKSPDLVRRLIERGWTVQVVMTGGAARFVTPLTFQAVSGRPVRTDLWDEAAEAAMGHIELARWADRVLIAPASADFIAQLASGSAGNLLSTVCLATEAPLAIAPAMNRQMWAHPAVQANVVTLLARGAEVYGPGEGEQACGETGAGRMLEPAQLADLVSESARAGGALAGRHVLITAGPTREAVDPVRFLSNRSSGKMGFALAAAARDAGARVTLVAGPVSLPTPAGVARVDVESAEQMHRAVHEHVGSADIFVAAAAVSDYRPATAQAEKIKKNAAEMRLELVRSPDILASVAALAEPPFTVGFAAETTRVREYALDKLRTKSLDMIVANQVGEGLVFDQDENTATALWDGGEQAFPTQSKRTLARELIACIAARYPAGPASADPVKLHGAGAS